MSKEVKGKEVKGKEVKGKEVKGKEVKGKKVKNNDEFLDECPQHGIGYDVTIEACQLCEADNPKYAKSCKAATPVIEKKPKKEKEEKSGKKKEKTSKGEFDGMSMCAFIREQAGAGQTKEHIAKMLDKKGVTYNKNTLSIQFGRARASKIEKGKKTQK